MKQVSIFQHLNFYNLMSNCLFSDCFIFINEILVAIHLVDLRLGSRLIFLKRRHTMGFGKSKKFGTYPDVYRPVSQIDGPPKPMLLAFVLSERPAVPSQLCW